MMMIRRFAIILFACALAFGQARAAEKIVTVTGEAPTQGPYFDVIRATDPDMHLRPDPGTVRIVPWATDPTAQVTG